MDYLDGITTDIGPELWAILIPVYEAAKLYNDEVKS